METQVMYLSKYYTISQDHVKGCISKIATDYQLSEDYVAEVCVGISNEQLKEFIKAVYDDVPLSFDGKPLPRVEVTEADIIRIAGLVNMSVKQLMDMKDGIRLVQILYHE